MNTKTRFLLSLIAIVVIGVSARMIVSAFAGGYGDQLTYNRIADAVQYSKNYYQIGIAYNYTPLWAWLLGAMASVRDVTGVPLFVIERGVLTFVDVCNAILIGLIVAERQPTRARFAFACYLLNPLIIYVTGLEGQFDVLAMLPILLAVYLYLRHAPNRYVWALVTLAICIKHIVLFVGWALLVYMFRVRHALLLMVGTAALFAATFIPYLPDGLNGIWEMVVKYKGIGGGVYGLGILLPTSITLPLFLAVMIALPLVARRLRLDLIQSLIFQTTAMFVFIPAVSENYWIILIAVGCLSITPMWWAYTAVTSVLVWWPWYWWMSMVQWWPVAVAGYNLELLTALLWCVGYFIPKRQPRSRSVLRTEVAAR